MISIGVITEDQYGDICELFNNGEYPLVFDENHLVMTARDKEDLLGIGVAYIKNDYAVIENIAVNEENVGMQLDYGLGKALLNTIDRRGITNVYCCNNKLVELLIQLRFNKNNNDIYIPEELIKCTTIYYLDLKNYFTEHSCKK